MPGDAKVRVSLCPTMVPLPHVPPWSACPRVPPWSERPCAPPHCLWGSGMLAVVALSCFRAVGLGLPGVGTPRGGDPQLLCRGAPGLHGDVTWGRVSSRHPGLSQSPRCSWHGRWHVTAAGNDPGARGWHPHPHTGPDVPAGADPRCRERGVLPMRCSGSPGCGMAVPGSPRCRCMGGSSCRCRWRWGWPRWQLPCPHLLALGTSARPAGCCRTMGTWDVCPPGAAAALATPVPPAQTGQERSKY